jgi:hypothetical protein
LLSCEVADPIPTAGTSCGDTTLFRTGGRSDAADALRAADHDAMHGILRDTEVMLRNLRRLGIKPSE